MNKALLFSSLIIVFLISFIATNSLSAQTQRFHQDRFAIGFWVDPPADEKMDQRYKEIAQANFTLVIGGFGARQKEDIARQMDLCDKYGLSLITNNKALPPETLVNAQSCWGTTLFDEPSTSQFAQLKTTVNMLRKKAPGKLAYINLLPNYASPTQLGADNYDQYVSRFVNEVNPDVLSMDYYPMMTPTTDGRQGYCDNLAVMRKYALEKNIPFWNFFNTMPFGPHFDPTESQLRWQIYTSIAYGAKGILYFCYYTPAGGEFPKGGAIITRDDRKTRHYDEAARINKAIKNLGPTLMTLTSTNVIRIKPNDNPAAILKDTPIRQLSPGDYLIGLFQTDDNHQAVLLNNYDHAYASWPTVTFNAKLENIVEIDQNSSRKIPVIDDSPAMEGLQISLDAGAGRLFIIE